MADKNASPFLVAVVGAGPAGLYAARQLAAAGARVVILNRDFKPGGLAEYGIYPDKFKMREGLRNQFRQILASPQISYFGNVRVGEHGDLTLDDLRGLGFQAILVTVGAQGTKRLGLDGENSRGVYHAKDIVYHYNRLPPYSEQPFPIGRRVAVVGAGNVMMDMAHWLVRDLQVDEVIAVVRRGPAEVKFDKREFEIVAANLDRAALDGEIARVAPLMQTLGQDPEAAKAEILAGQLRMPPPVSVTRFRFLFLASPTRILHDAADRVCGLELEENTLIPFGGSTRPRGLGILHVLPVDTVIFAIGDRVDESLGLALQGSEFAKNPEPQFPIDGISYEAYDPRTCAPVPGVFLAGWARVASTGLVGVARKDGERGARAVLEYLRTLPAADMPIEPAMDYLRELRQTVITEDDLQQIEAAERAEAARRGVAEWKFPSNLEMLEFCRGLKTSPQAAP